MALLFQSSLQKGVKFCATPNTFLGQPKDKDLMDAPFGHYIRIKPQDNMLIFYFLRPTRVL